MMMVHDIFGWTFPNARLLADHYAKEADATVFLPDLYSSHHFLVKISANPNSKQWLMQTL